jgi:hypothetical protein
MLIELLRSLQLSRKKREGGLYWPGPQQPPVHTPQITMEIYISDWIHKFQNKTGLDAKANLELYKSKRVCSEEKEDIHTTQYTVLYKAQSTYIPRVPQCPSPRRNWDPPSPLPQASLYPPPPPNQRRGEQSRLRLRVRGWVGETQFG